jgi:hypothetical protein
MSNSSCAACPSQQDDDTPLSITASVASLLTFAYAAAAGVIVFYRSFSSSRVNFEQSAERFERFVRELEVLTQQTRDDDVVYRGLQSSSYPTKLLDMELSRTELLFKEVNDHFKRTGDALTSLKKSALGTYGENRSLLSLFSYYLPLDFPYAKTWFKILFWFFLPMYTVVIVLLNLGVILVNICLLLDIRWLVGKARLLGRQDEVLDMMRRTEDLFREVRVDTSNRYDSNAQNLNLREIQTVLTFRQEDHPGAHNSELHGKRSPRPPFSYRRKCERAIQAGSKAKSPPYPK